MYRATRQRGLKMSYTYEDNIISDLHKDAYGFRPSQRFFDDWAQYTPAEKQDCWDLLIDAMKASQAQEEAAEAANLVEFRKQVAATMKFCDCNWKKAVEFLADAEGDDVDCDQDFDYFLWKQGIGYNDRAKIRKLYKES
jgi:hypothetical protein